MQKPKPNVKKESILLIYISENAKAKALCVQSRLTYIPDGNNKHVPIVLESLLE